MAKYEADQALQYAVARSIDAQSHIRKSTTAATDPELAKALENIALSLNGIARGLREFVK